MIRRNISAAVIVSLLLVFSAGPAQAAFSFRKKSDDASGVSKTDLKMAGGRTVTFVQIGSGEAEKRSSVGKNLPLSSAMNIILPDSWDHQIQRDFRKVKVSWKSSSEPWTDTLKKIGRKQGLRFVVNWRTQKIAAGDRALGKMTKAFAGPETTTKRLAKKSWKLVPGSLKEQLSRWAEWSGYKLIWDSSYDYRIDAGKIFEGDFEKAVKKTVEALYRNGARIRADIYKANKVLYISGDKQ